jgi:DNA polymerase-1
VFPPSIHADTGELIAWHVFDQVGRVGLDGLLISLGELASASLLGRYWPNKGSRQDTALALAGALLNASWDASRAERFMRAVLAAARDEEATKRLNVIEQTAAKRQAGKQITGWPTLQKLLGPFGADLVQRLRDWLGLLPKEAAEPWEEPLPFATYLVPPFPLDCLPPILVNYVNSVSRNTQTPPDLAAMLVLSVCGAGLAKKFRVCVRKGWGEPLNLFTVTALPPGDRKSAVFTNVMEPVLAFEREEQDRMAPIIAVAACEHQLLEARFKYLQGKAAKATDAEERTALQEEAKEVAKELRTHHVPDPPQFMADDVTPEELGRLMAKQGGKMLLASAEGTIFEIAKGRYSDTAKFEVFLKGHAGDDLRINRISRESNFVPEAALSCGLAVQPDVIHGLAEEATLRGRGFLARWCYSVPISLVGRRAIAGAPVPADVKRTYDQLVRALWQLEGTVDERGRPAPNWLHFSPAAEKLMRDFETELEPRLGDDGDLFHLAGWANKLAGAIARIAGILHICFAVSAGESWQQPVSETTVSAAIRLGRDYLLPHALAAFGLMGADFRATTAKRLLRSLLQARDKEGKLISCFSRRDAQRLLGRHVQSVQEVDLVLELLVRHHFIRPQAMPRREGRGQPASQLYEINPRARECNAESAPPVDNEDRNDRKGAEAATEPNSVNSVISVNGVPGFSEGGEAGMEQPINRFVVVKPEDLQAVCQAVDESADLVGLDLETTGLDPREHRIRLLSLATDRGIYLVDCFQVDPSPLWPSLADKTIVAHNAAFDLGFLAAVGFETGPVRDTMILSQVVGAGSQLSSKLEDCVSRELGRQLDKQVRGSDWSGQLTPEQLHYAAADVEVLVPLYRALEAKIREAGLEKVADIEHRCIPGLVWLSRCGILFDPETWGKLAEQAEADCSRLATELDALARPPRQPDMFSSGWNWDSPEQVKEALNGVGCAAEATDDDTLAKLDHPLAEKLREYREARKRCTTYGREWMKYVANDGRVYASWRQIGASSGRMSCSMPNLQQLPRGKHRTCFRAPPGRVLVKGDYSQIELRIAAKISGDPNMLAAYQSGQDLHTLTAQRLLGKQEVTKEDRQIAKSANFGLLYGMGATGYRNYAKSNYAVEMTEAQATAYREAFFTAYPGLRKWHRLASHSSDRAIETRTLVGRRRLEVQRFTEKLNTPVQGTGADGLKQALALLWERRDQAPGAFPVLAVHDEIVIECDAEQAEAVVAWLRQAMLDGFGDWLGAVPVAVEVKIAPTWGG